MNKRKKWIIAAVILLGAGVLIFGITLVTLGFDLSGLDNGRYVTNTYDIDEDFHDISIQVGSDDIQVKPSEDGKCRVVCCEEDSEKHEVCVEDGILIVTAPDKWFDFDLFSFKGPSVTVYLPESEYANLSIDAGTGDIQLEEGLTFDKISVDLSTGTVDCDVSSKGNMAIKASTGDIDVTGASAADMTLIVTTGAIRGNSIQCDGKMDVQVTTGDIKLETVNCKDLYSTGSTGDLIMKDVIASGEFHLERSTGDIRFDGCDAGTIYAKTSTGDVTGTLLSEKVFITNTSTGDVNVPPTTEGGKCEITTSTGDILISLS